MCGIDLIVIILTLHSHYHLPQRGALDAAAHGVECAGQLAAITD
jgi:hypothetical protein